MQAVAPSATALTMSLPRRTPPSQMISMRPPSACGDRRDEVDRRRRRVELAAAVVRQRDGVDAVVGGEDGIGDALDALDHDRARPHRAQPLDVGPRQVGIELAVDVRRQRDGVACRRRARHRRVRPRWRSGSDRPARTTTSNRDARRRRAACRARASVASRSPAARRARADRARPCRPSARAPRSRRRRCGRSSP